MARRTAKASEARAPRPRTPWLLGLLAAGVAVGCAAPAGAVVVSAGAGGARVGVQPIGGPAAVAEDPLDGTSTGVTYHGGPVAHALTTYAVYWDPGGAFQASTEQLIDGFLAGGAHDSGSATNVFSVSGQYTDGTGSAGYAQSFGGGLIDHDAYPASGGCSTTTGSASTCIYDSQLRSELEQFIAANQLPVGPADLYVMLTPTTVVTCLDGSSECSNNSYCSLHSYATDNASTLLYITIPFTLLDSAGDAKSCQADGNGELQLPNGETGFGDVAVKSLAHEMLETVSDPMLNAWYDADGNEIADLCNGVASNPSAFLPIAGGVAAAGTLFNQTIDGAHYYVQGTWSNQANGCALSSALEPTISGVPASIERGVAVNLSATPGTGAAVASYAWSFGDGQTASGASASHIYATDGTYAVTLDVTDQYGNSGSTSEQIVVTNAAGSTAAASGSSRSAGFRATRTCSSVRQGRHGLERRKCTTTKAVRMADTRMTTRRKTCLYVRSSASRKWSRRHCTASVRHH